MLRRRLLTTLLLVPLAVALMGAAVLKDPDPIEVPGKLSAKEVSQAIRAGVTKRDWVVMKDEKGKMDVVLNVRSHEVKVQIDYDTKLVKINYVSSANLDFEEKKGVRHIHKKYNQWVQNMANDIRNALGSAAAAKS